jgi:hypothetical protein
MIKRTYYSLKNLHQSVYHNCVTFTFDVGVTPCSMVEGSDVSKRPVSDILRINGGGKFIRNLGVY